LDRDTGRPGNNDAKEHREMGERTGTDPSLVTLRKSQPCPAPHSRGLQNGETLQSCVVEASVCGTLFWALWQL
jgi:hypothetical protein